MFKQKLKRFLKLGPFRELYIIFNLTRDSNMSIFKLLRAKKKNYLFMTAMHNNAGDLAQTVCIDEWLSKNYPDAVTVNVAWASPEDEPLLRKVCSKIKSGDRIFIHSGYNITDICSEFGAPGVFSSHKIIIDANMDKKIVFFPQSVEYKSLKKWKPVQDMYLLHPDIVFISRDNISKEYAIKLLPKAFHLSYPDIVTTWIGRYSFGAPEKDILLCLRTGAESIIIDEVKDYLRDGLRDIGSVEETDTDLACSSFYYRGHRKAAVMTKIREFSRYKVIVTDRYHGVIFSLIAGRPVVVLKTKGHKVKSAIDWFPREFDDYVHFIDEPQKWLEVVDIVNDIMKKDLKPLKSTYFNDDVYSRLRDEIDNEHQK